MKAELRKIEGCWTIIISREDGTSNVYRLYCKRKAANWAAKAGATL